MYSFFVFCAYFSVGTCLQNKESANRLPSLVQEAGCPVQSNPRPQIHFSPKKNWMNDPNGLVYYEGEYHLFFQYCLKSKRPDSKSWGHAVSDDLLHWKELPTALDPDKNGDIWSGSTIVDWKNSSGLQLPGKKPPLVAFYTNMPKMHPDGADGGLTEIHSDQRIAVSHDLGRTWTKSPLPAVGQFPDDYRRQARDPKVQWHEATQHWIMVLYVHSSHVLLYRSRNLQDWEELQDIGFQGAYECPDLFELPVVGDKEGARYWVMMMGDGRYQVGTFDGTTFKSVTDVQDSEFGVGYAGATYNEEPKGRRVQISWLKPPYSRDHPLFEDVDFTGVMSVPMELDLVRHASGLFVRRSPITELKGLRMKHPLINLAEVGKDVVWPLRSKPSSGSNGLELRMAALLPTGTSIVVSITTGARNMGAKLRLHGLQDEGSTALAEVVWNDLRGATKSYIPDKNFKWTLGDPDAQNSTSMPLVAEDRRVAIHMVVDWGTLEVFDNAGGASMALYAPDFAETLASCAPLYVEVSSVDESAKLTDLAVFELEAAMS